MSRYNRQLHDVGVLLDVNGLHSPNEALRLSFPGGKSQVVDGPFAETKELVGGYWIIDVKSKAEAIERAERCPIDAEGPMIEVRQIFEISGFPPELWVRATLSPPVCGLGLDRRQASLVGS